MTTSEKLAKIVNVLDEIPDKHAAARATANVDTAFVSNVSDSYFNNLTPQKAIRRTFIWERSPEGYRYWSTVWPETLDNYLRTTKELPKGEEVSSEIL